MGLSGVLKLQWEGDRGVLVDKGLCLHHGKLYVGSNQYCQAVMSEIFMR